MSERVKKGSFEGVVVGKVDQINDNLGDIPENTIIVVTDEVDESLVNLENRMDVVEGDIIEIEDGTTVVGKALKDDLGNTIKSTYANKLDLVYSSSNNRIAITLKSYDGTTIDADLIDLPKATPSADGLLLKEDKVKINDLPNASTLTGQLNTKADKATTLAGYGITDTYTKTEVNNRTTAIYRVKGNVPTYASLPSSEQATGDVYNVVDTGINYVWNGTEWDDIGGVEALATVLENGLMSKDDFVKLQGLDAALGLKADKNYVDEQDALKINKTVPITHASLVALRDSASLIPGQQYRITDYVTTTVQEDTQSAGHRFDIIVTADDVDKLNENARAVHSDRDVPIFKGITASIATNFGEAGDVLKKAFSFDNSQGTPEGFIYAWGTNADISDGDDRNFLYTQSDTPAAGDAVYKDYSGYGTVVSIIEEEYFANSKLEAWKLKYCLDNYTDRFAWADEVNGKGVIYRMIDEFNNDVPYDFKNIQFKRKLTDGELDLDSGMNTWVYTFTGISYEHFTLIDGTVLKASEYFTDEGSNLYKNNKIGIYEYKRFHEDGNDKIIQQLNNIVFIGAYDEEPYGEEGPAKLVLFSYNNVLGANCHNITFGNNCANNTIGNNCNFNTFGNVCNFNTFGNGCFNNTFGNGCRYNTFGNDCNSNTFGNDCNSNTFGNGCNSNTFGNGCGSNIFDNDCYYNTFGNGCGSNIFDNDCYYNTFGNGCYYNTFGNDCYYLQISNTSWTAKKHISVENGTQGASNNNQFDLYDSAILNKNYQVTFKKSASGKYLMLWATDTGTMTGKVKATNTTATWSDIV